MSEFTVLSLTTDYGLDDGFVAQCHGVAIQRAPGVRIVDVTHAIPPGDVERGSVVLAQTVPSLPRGVHVAVVDPGVGTTRRPVAVDTGAGILVGPDNGVLARAADALGGARRAVALTNAELHRHPTSHTFHGRDIFTPVGAALMTGTAWEDLGDPMRVAELVRLPEPRGRADAEGFAAQVLSIDRFGNVQLALPGGVLENYGEKFRIGRMLATRGDMFAAADSGALVVLVDAAGQVAIAVNRGSAAEVLGVDAGDTVEVHSAE